MQARICILSGWNAIGSPPSVDDMTMNSAQPGRTAVQLLDVRKSYPSGQNRVWALRGAFLALAPGSFTAIMGPSGSGKSTLLQCAAGLESPETGRITIGDHVISDLSPDALTRFRREHIGFVFQDYNLVGHLDVNANIALPMVLGGEQLDPAWGDHLLASVGLGGLQSRRPSQLSGVRPSGSPSHGHWPADPPWSSRTSPQGRSTRTPPVTCSRCSAAQRRGSGRRW